MPQLGEPSRTLNDTNSARQHAACVGHDLTPRSKNLRLVGARNGHDVLKFAERPKLSDPAHGSRGLQPERGGRVRCSAWLSRVLLTLTSNARIGKLVCE